MFLLQSVGIVRVTYIGKSTISLGDAIDYKLTTRWMTGKFVLQCTTLIVDPQQLMEK